MNTEIDVYSIGSQWVGIARSFGEAKRMQLDSLPDDLKDAYAGIHNGSPLFYTEKLTPELIVKYPGLQSE